MENPYELPPYLQPPYPGEHPSEEEKEQQHLHDAWEEGHTAAEAEQAEVVTELVTALSFYLVDWSMDGTIHQATIDFAIAAQEKARKAIAKAKGE